VVRNSVKEAFRGQEVIRRKTRLELISGGKIRPIHVLITASPFHYEERRLALLVIEDISEQEEIRRIIPSAPSARRFGMMKSTGTNWRLTLKSIWTWTSPMDCAPNASRSLWEKSGRLKPKDPGRK